jgi:hypothetical protein
MESRYQTVFFGADDMTAYSADGTAVICHVPIGCSPKRNDEHGADDLDLPQEVWAACESFRFCGNPVAGGAAFDDIGDIDVLAGAVENIFYHSGQKISCAPYERMAGAVFRGSGPFSHEEKICFGIAFSKNHFVAMFAQIAQMAVFSHLPQTFKIPGQFHRFVFQIGWPDIGITIPHLPQQMKLFELKGVVKIFHKGDCSKKLIPDIVLGKGLWL